MNAVVAAALTFAAACDPTVTSIGALALPDASDGAAADRGRYFEAEEGALSGGFTVEADPTASSGRYLLAGAGTASEDTPDPARATYTFTTPAAGSYTLWGRIRAPGADDNRFWVRVDDGSWFKWRISVGDIWYWATFHVDRDYDTPLAFSLTPGPHTLVLASCVEGAALDRLYATAGGDVPPGNDTRCKPPNSIELAGVCHPSCGGQGGNACGGARCAGLVPIASYDCDVCCVVPDGG